MFLILLSFGGSHWLPTLDADMVMYSLIGAALMLCPFWWTGLKEVKDKNTLLVSGLKMQDCSEDAIIKYFEERVGRKLIGMKVTLVKKNDAKLVELADELDLVREAKENQPRLPRRSDEQAAENSGEGTTQQQSRVKPTADDYEEYESDLLKEIDEARNSNNECTGTALVYFDKKGDAADVLGRMGWSTRISSFLLDFLHYVLVRFCSRKSNAKGWLLLKSLKFHKNGVVLLNQTSNRNSFGGVTGRQPFTAPTTRYFRSHTLHGVYRGV